jgi:sulfonate transport system substrate-binding protein
MPRFLLALVFASLGCLVGAGCNGHDSVGPALKVLRVGYQKGGVFSLLKSQQTLERRLEPLGIQVEWLQFPAGPPLLEALNAGSIHIGHTGDSPPLFAQAAGVAFKYVGASTPSPASSAILAGKNSGVRELAGLRGKKVGFTKGSSAHTLVLRALPSVGLSIHDIESVYLSPSDARAALEAVAIDAWAIWDPYLAAIENEQEVCVLVRGEGLVSGREFYLASAELLNGRRDLVEAFLAELERTKKWASSRPREVAEFQAEQIGMPVRAMDLAERRRGRYGAESNAAALIAEQQRIADEFFAGGLLPRTIAVQEAFELVPGVRQASR